jgi:hypothetical protein
MWEQDEKDGSFTCKCPVTIEDAKQRFIIENKWGRKQKKSTSVVWPDENHATETVKHA